MDYGRLVLPVLVAYLPNLMAFQYEYVIDVIGFQRRNRNHVGHSALQHGRPNAVTVWKE